jgi:eukaryotic-like serine/threonine-protein kinase
MPQQWFIETQGRSIGPYNARRLQDLATTGQLAPVDRVSPDGRRWVSAFKVKGLAFPNSVAEITDTKRSAVVPITKSPEATSLFIPGYEIQELLGAGACGTVYRAKQNSLNRVIALKVVEIPSRQSSVFERFQQEAQLLAKLDHPNIVPVFDSGRDSARVYLAMALLEGEDLERRIRRLGHLDERTTWMIARQTAEALAHAAKHGIIHRDIKPANLFLTGSNSGPPGDGPVVKVMDFGLACARQPEEEQRITQQGVVVGTPAYMAPEQFSQSDVTIQADIYALGTTIYHALAGKMPFAGNTIWDVMVKKNESAPKLTGVHVQTAKLVADMMHPNPAKRIRDYAELSRRIEELPFWENQTPAKRVRTRSPRLAKRAMLAGVGIVILLVAFLWWRGSAEYLSTPPERYHSNGRPEVLSDNVNLASWMIDGTVRFEPDGEGNEVLTTAGRVSWAYRPSEADRISLGFDLHRAESVDVAFVPRNSDGEWLAVRLSRTEGIQLGILKPNASFTRLSPILPFPTDRMREGLVPYQTVELQRVGNRWDAWVEGHYLGGVQSSSAKKSPEIQVRTDGRAVRIERVELDRLHR